VIVLPPERHVVIPANAGLVALPGSLSVPPAAAGIVIFAGGGRRDAGQRSVAGRLNRTGFGTLLCDLLTDDERGLDAAEPAGIGLVVGRLRAVSRWLRVEAGVPQPIGYFAAGAAVTAALWAAAEPDADMGAIVCIGGRPDLAMPRLGQVRAPTLLLVGDEDETLVSRNREAHARLLCRRDLVVVQGATQPFRLDGNTPSVAQLAGGWYHAYLTDDRRQDDLTSE
jgi:putative phosphoribosyl transferase